MRYHDCDQIGNDLYLAARKVSEKYRVCCSPDLEQAEGLVEEVERLNTRSRPLKQAIELALMQKSSLTATDREAYRLALTKIIGRRKGAAREARIERDKATDFPRGQEM